MTPSNMIGGFFSSNSQHSVEFMLSNNLLQFDRRKRSLYVHIRIRRKSLNYYHCTAAAVVAPIFQGASRGQTFLAAAVDSPSTYDILRCDWSVFHIELTTLGRIQTPQQPSLHSTGEKNDVTNCKHQITGIDNDQVPRTARSPEKARVVDPRRERVKGRQPPSKAKPRGSNRPMAARKAWQSVESGSIGKTERSNLGDTKAKIEHVTIRSWRSNNNETNLQDRRK